MIMPGDFSNGSGCGAVLKQPDLDWPFGSIDLHLGLGLQIRHRLGWIKEVRRFDQMRHFRHDSLDLGFQAAWQPEQVDGPCLTDAFVMEPFRSKDGGPIRGDFGVPWEIVS